MRDRRKSIDLAQKLTQRNLVLDIQRDDRTKDKQCSLVTWIILLQQENAYPKSCRATMACIKSCRLGAIVYYVLVLAYVYPLVQNIAARMRSPMHSSSQWHSRILDTNRESGRKTGFDECSATSVYGNVCLILMRNILHALDYVRG